MRRRIALLVAILLFATTPVYGSYLGDLLKAGIDAASQQIKITHKSLRVGGGYVDIPEITAPASPSTNDGRLYVADSGGTTKLYFKDSAGTTTDLTTASVGSLTDAANGVWFGTNALVFEGATADAYETSIVPTDPTADRTITLPDASGTAMVSTLATNAPEAANSVWGASNGLVFEGATANAYETTLTVTDPTADRTITLPDRTGTIVLEQRAVSAKTQADSPLTLTAALGNVYTNSGASDALQINLPEASTWIGQKLTFVVLAAQNLTINPDDADQILGLTNAVGDAIRSATVGTTVELMAVDATNIIVLGSYGTWSDVN